MRQLLTTRILERLQTPKVDSPVYTFLSGHQLRTPSAKPPAMGGAGPLSSWASERRPTTIRRPAGHLISTSPTEIIRAAVEEAGLECVRADEILHSGVIDLPIYEHLATADLVIADLSTSNANPIYELGIRHALRPYTTIVIAEDKFRFRFDLGHLHIWKYEHLGKDIGVKEADG